DPPFTLPLKGQCKPGTMQCVPKADGTAAMKCVGFVGPLPQEICNGLDDDCDGVADNMAICPSPTDACIEAKCEKPCAEGGFPGGFGFRCKDFPNIGRFCTPNPCDAITCDVGFPCNPETAMCEDLCKNVNCITPRKCVAGRCVDCFTTGCAPPTICR